MLTPVNLFCDELVEVEAESSTNLELTSDSVIRAFECPILLRDERVLQNLLAIESRYLIIKSYFGFQPEVLPYMRDTVVSWMLEVCDEQSCEEEVLTLSVNYLDRFLSQVEIRKSQLQLVASACMLLASKFKETTAIPPYKLVMYTDYSITVHELLDWELFVVQTLKWDISTVTPHDYLEQMLTRLPIESNRAEPIKRHSQTFIAMCSTDLKFSLLRPSLIAAACLSASINGLLGHSWSEQIDLLHRLQTIISTDAAVIKSCQDDIEQLLNNQVQGDANTSTTSPPSTPTSSGKPYSAKHHSTPTDVRDVRLCH